MEINDILGSQIQTPVDAPSAELGQEDFLRMLLAQLPLSHGLWLSIPSVNDSSVVMFWTVVII